MTWSLRYTTHLGYQPPAFRPQFLELAGAGCVEQIHFAAQLGMAGVLYPWAVMRPPAEVKAVADALRATQLACSCIVVLPANLLATPIWTQRDAASRSRLHAEVTRSAQLAASLGSTVLAVLIMADAARAEQDQLEDVVANLRDMAQVAAAHGLTLGIEPMVARPNMLLRNVASTLELISGAAQPNIGVIFDTSHVYMMEGDINGAFSVACKHVCLLQLVDQPGRVEPGAGMLDLQAVAAQALRMGYAGLVDFEHGWQDNSRSGEQNGLERLREFDRSVRSAVE